MAGLAQSSESDSGSSKSDFGIDWVGCAPVFLDAVRMIRRIATYQATTLVEGETGTGKELAARAIHYLGARRDFPFVPVNCGALPDTLVESDLFGHEKGAFTDAKERRAGLVAEASGGTLFLDEVEAMSPRAQVVLLRFLQDQKYRPVGSHNLSSGNVRIIAASNADLSELARSNLFRRDLLFRLSVLHVRLPPLRERVGDPPLLAQAFVQRFSKVYNRPPKRLHADSIRWCASYDWPGNVRELESLTLREFLLGDGDELRIGAPSKGVTVVDEPSELDQTFRRAKALAVARFEELYLRKLMAKTKGNVTLAAKLCHKDRSALSRLVRKYRLSLADFADRDGL